jgi:hypothetical protein
MDTLTVPVGPDELLSLEALIKLSPAVEHPSLESVARLALREGLTTRLGKLALPWAPSAEEVEQAKGRLAAVGPPSSPTERESSEVSSTHAAGQRMESTGTASPDREPKSRLGSVLANRQFRIGGMSALAAAVVVVLFGGYVRHWSWTGFDSNKELWDWMHLLVLPVALGTLPLWLRYGEHMSVARKAAFLAVIVAFLGFVLAGYLVPLKWTGFSGNTLWDWLTLLVLPVTLTTIKVWPSSPREVNPRHVSAFSLIVTAWLVTLVGGYAGTWAWTGYPGNTLWDWLQLLLVPLVFTTLVLPAAVRWVSGNVAERAREAEKAKEAAALD